MSTKNTFYLFYEKKAEVVSIDNYIKSNNSAIYDVSLYNKNSVFNHKYGWYENAIDFKFLEANEELNFEVVYYVDDLGKKEIELVALNAYYNDVTNSLYKIGIDTFQDLIVQLFKAQKILYCVDDMRDPEEIIIEFKS